MASELKIPHGWKNKVILILLAIIFGFVFVVVAAYKQVDVPRYDDLAGFDPTKKSVLFISNSLVHEHDINRMTESVSRDLDPNFNDVPFIRVSFPAAKLRQHAKAANDIDSELGQLLAPANKGVFSHIVLQE